jgi:hypothetical protein
MWEEERPTRPKQVWTGPGVREGLWTRRALYAIPRRVQVTPEGWHDHTRVVKGGGEHRIREANHKSLVVVVQLTVIVSGTQRPATEITKSEKVLCVRSQHLLLLSVAGSGAWRIRMILVSGFTSWVDSNATC